MRRGNQWGLERIGKYVAFRKVASKTALGEIFDECLD
jgi:hypothetical protein